MADNDLIVLEDAKDAAFTIDKAYRRAIRKRDLDAAMKLKPKVEDAYSALSAARLRLMEEGMLATDADVAEMRRLKAEIDEAAETQQMIEGAITMAKFLAKFV